MRKITEHIVESDLPQNQLKIEVTDEPGAGGASHHYRIIVPQENGNHLYYLIRFQEGPIQEAGLNGLTQEALLAIVIDRLQSFQGGPFPCDENEAALEHCRAALLYLKRRTEKRLARGVEGQTKP